MDDNIVFHWRLQGIITEARPYSDDSRTTRFYRSITAQSHTRNAALVMLHLKPFCYGWLLRILTK